MKKTNMIYILGSNNDPDLIGAYKDWHDALEDLFEMAIDVYCEFYDKEKVLAECEERAYDPEKDSAYMPYLWVDEEENTPFYIQQMPLF